MELTISIEDIAAALKSGDKPTLEIMQAILDLEPDAEVMAEQGVRPDQAKRYLRWSRDDARIGEIVGARSQLAVLCENLSQYHEHRDLSLGIYRRLDHTEDNPRECQVLGITTLLPDNRPYVSMLQFFVDEQGVTGLCCCTLGYFLGRTDDCELRYVYYGPVRPKNKQP